MIHEDVIKALHLRDDGLSEKYPDEVKEDKWRPFLVLRGGQSLLGVHCYQTEADCWAGIKKATMDAVELMNSSFATDVRFINPAYVSRLGRPFLFSQIVDAFPMPVKS